MLRESFNLKYSSFLYLSISYKFELLVYDNLMWEILKKNYFTSPSCRPPDLQSKNFLHCVTENQRWWSYFNGIARFIEIAAQNCKENLLVKYGVRYNVLEYDIPVQEKKKEKKEKHPIYLIT